MRELIVCLKGGLGNQMFQYAAGRAFAIQKGMQLVLDVRTGFVRDKTYRRRFMLSELPVTVRYANRLQQLPFWYERARNRVLSISPKLVQERPWGIYLCETETKYHTAVAQIGCATTIFMEGFWQSEKYFADYRELLRKELTPSVPSDDLYLSTARKIEECNSVSVGVRLFEEVPGASKHGVGGLVPYSFYGKAADRIAEEVNDPTFFVFCTKKNGVSGKLHLPGKVYYVTHDDGYIDTMKLLWLISRCRHHILSNSSFYWWGAWLSEQNFTSINKVIIASDKFVNSDCIPSRWITIAS